MCSSRRGGRGVLLQLLVIFVFFFFTPGAVSLCAFLFFLSTHTQKKKPSCDFSAAQLRCFVFISVILSVPHEGHVTIVFECYFFFLFCFSPISQSTLQLIITKQQQQSKSSMTQTCDG